MRRIRLGVLVWVALTAVSLAEVRAGLSIVKVSQRHRTFDPGSLTVNRGDTVQIINDDGELIHHAYVDAPAFKFDSGEQDPGSKIDEVFTVAGNFTVLCRIHPRMRLDVTVR